MAAILRHPVGPAGLLGVLLVGVTLPYGGGIPPLRPWWAALALLMAALAVATVDRPLPPVGRVVSGILVAFAALGVLQARVDRSFFQEGTPFLSRPQVAQLTASPLLPASVSPGATASAVWDWAGAGAILFGATLVGTSRRGRRALLVAVLMGAFLQLCVGLVSLLSGNQTLWGEQLPYFGLRLRGTFVNPNHFALWLGIAWCVSLGVFAHWLRHHRKREEEAVPWALTVSALLSPVVLLAALLATRSRGALLMVLTTAVVWFLLYRQSLTSMQRRVLAAGLVLVALSIAFAGGQTLFERFVGPTGEGLDTGGRLTVVQTSLGLWGAHPIWGTGLGTFEVAFSRVQPPGLGGRWRHAHQDGAELLVTTGLVGFALFLLGAILILRALFKGFRHAAGSEERDACAAALLSMVAALVHGLFDFGITLPANAWLLAAVVGAAVGATGWGRSSSPKEELDAPT